jgi:predicted TIM-barrel fold metal-dependent hydrolase
MKIVVQIPPDNVDRSAHFDAEAILAAAKKYPDKIVVLGGGATLNAMIQKSVASGNAGVDIQNKFKQSAEELLSRGGSGFGEMTAEPFDGATPYQYAPANHPLFILLSDIAAKHNVPIVLHMEAVPQDMTLPANLKSPPNAPRLHENIQAFERLLDHNKRTKIVWAHAGADGTGYRTPGLCRQLLTAHANLYMDLKVDPLNPGKNYPLMPDGKIKPDWLELFRDFPDRFVLGSDQHYPEPAATEQRWQAEVLLFNQLPLAVQEKIGKENALRIFGGRR